MKGEERGPKRMDGNQSVELFKNPSLQQTQFYQTFKNIFLPFYPI